MSDEGFHEIQLNGKQLVFLFMAATVVSVVIFLLGVMVGRGVPARAQAREVAETVTVDPTAIVQASRSAAADSDRAPVSAQESLTYAERLAAPTPAQDTLRSAPAPAVEPPVKAPPSVEAPPPVRESPPPAPVRQPAPPTASAKPAAFPEPSGDGFAVQVGAHSLANAETIAGRLVSKGYPTFIVPRGQELYAVRVGKYSDRREAENVARRLEQQEQFNKPWVTR